MDPLATWKQSLKTLRQDIRESLEAQASSGFTIQSYEDKNKYLKLDTIAHGYTLFRNREYQFSEIFWRSILEETRLFRKTNSSLHINVGLPLANLGISLIAQGKVLDGVMCLYNAFDDDKETLEEFNLGDIDPMAATIESGLFKQFERAIVSALHIGKRKGTPFYPIPVGTFGDRLQKYLNNLGSTEHFQLFYILAELDDTLRKSNRAALSPAIIIPKLATTYLQLSMFLESKLKLKQGKPNLRFFELLKAELKANNKSYIMDKTFLIQMGLREPKDSKELDRALAAIAHQLKTKSLIERKCLTSNIIRNYYIHNATDITENLFIKGYIKYCYWLLDLVLDFE